MGTGSLSWLGYCVAFPSLSSAEVKGRVELYFYSPSGPLIACNLPFFLSCFGLSAIFRHTIKFNEKILNHITYLMHNTRKLVKKRNIKCPDVTTNDTILFKELFSILAITSGHVLLYTYVPYCQQHMRHLEFLLKVFTGIP
jgi:hypothetical protein